LNWCLDAGAYDPVSSKFKIRFSGGGSSWWCTATTGLHRNLCFQHVIDCTAHLCKSPHLCALVVACDWITATGFLLDYLLGICVAHTL